MYRIDYIKDSTRYNIWLPFSENYKIISGKYHRETNKAGKLTFAILSDHPTYAILSEYRGVVELYYDGELLFKSRILRLSSNLYNTLTVECEGLLTYLNDSKIPPYTFNKSNWIFPTPHFGTGDINDCKVVSYIQDVLSLHNSQVKEFQKFELIDETDGAFDDVTLQTSSTAYTAAWNELESKVLQNVGGYVDVRYGDNINYLVFKSALTTKSGQSIRYSVNLKDLEISSSSEEFCTAILPRSTYTDNDGKSQVIGIYTVNDGKEYIEDPYIAAIAPRIIKVVNYEGISYPEMLKWLAERDYDKHRNQPDAIKISAVDMSVINKDKYRPLKIDENLDLISSINNLRTTALLNAFDVDLIDPRNSTFTFNCEVKSYVRKQYR